MISSGDNVQDLKPIVSGISQTLRPVVPAATNEEDHLRDALKFASACGALTVNGGKCANKQPQITNFRVEYHLHLRST